MNPLITIALEFETLLLAVAGMTNERRQENMVSKNLFASKSAQNATYAAETDAAVYVKGSTGPVGPAGSATQVLQLDYIVNRFDDRLNNLGAVLNRLAAVSERLLGPRLANDDAKEEPQDYGTPLDRLNRLEEKQHSVLNEIFRLLDGLETI